jgi:hypothetical protein
MGFIVVMLEAQRNDAGRRHRRHAMTGCRDGHDRVMTRTAAPRLLTGQQLVADDAAL